LSLCFNWTRHEDVLGEWRCSSTHSLTSALDGSSQLHAPSALPPGHFNIMLSSTSVVSAAITHFPSPTDVRISN
jgi:hypothetical protein